MQRISFSRFYPHLMVSRHPSILDESLQFYEENFEDLSDVKPLDKGSFKEKRNAKKRPLFSK